MTPAALLTGEKEMEGGSLHRRMGSKPKVLSSLSKSLMLTDLEGGLYLPRPRPLPLPRPLPRPRLPTHTHMNV